ncbi:MAG: hypothetical protein N2C12_16425 [Planctomycetales bacterium]
MNFFAHGSPHADEPYFLAGTAVPDWLNVVDRKIRVRIRHATLFAEHTDPVISAVAKGVLRHHQDDDWFHRTRAFAELSLQFTVQIRDALDPDDGLRCHFLGHILVELLLDSELIAEKPDLLEGYYDALKNIDARRLADAVTLMSGRRADGLAYLIPRFISERFLCDYGQDEKLLMRLNQVMRRVRLDPLPDRFLQVLPGARQNVRNRRNELLDPLMA